jgi:integrase
MVFAAARYQGMRVPSETQLLTWDDIFWGENRMRVRSPKTAHHAGKATRIIPIFPEFMRFLLLAFSDAERDEKYVFKKLRGENLRTTALKIIERAGVRCG